MVCETSDKKKIVLKLEIKTKKTWNNIIFPSHTGISHSLLNLAFSYKNFSKRNSHNHHPVNIIENTLLRFSICSRLLQQLDHKNC